MQNEANSCGWRLFVAFMAVVTFGVSDRSAFASDDKSTVGAAMELLGVNFDERPTTQDYRERARLVVPPNRAGLAEPRSATSERPGNWPTNAASRPLNRDRYARIYNAPAEEKKPGILDRMFGKRDKSIAPGTEGEPGLLQRTLMGRRDDNPEANTTEPPRRMLTDPPTGYRQPTRDLSTVRDNDRKPSGFFGGLMGGGGRDQDADPVAQTANTAPSNAPSAVAGAGSGRNEEAEGALSSIWRWTGR